MILKKQFCLVVLCLLVSSCYSRPPVSSVGWAYAVGDPILYERPLYPYNSSGNYSDYWRGYAPYYSTTGSYAAPYYSGSGSYPANYQRINQTGVINVIDSH